MNDLVKTIKGKVTVSSKDIADRFSKRNDNVMRDISKLECSDEFRALNYEESSYLSLQNKKLDCINMTKDGFVFLCMGFSGPEAAEWKEKYIAAFNTMESALKKTPITMDQLNELVKRVEGNKEAASVAGRALRSYREIKQQDADDFKCAVNQAQMALNI
jgi:Rha family phage regulatory protein